MHKDFLPALDAEQRAQRCSRANHLRVPDERIAALIELVKALRPKFNQNYRAGVGLGGDLSEILKGLDDPSNLLPQLAIVRGYGSYSDLEVAFLISGKLVCCSIIAASPLGAMVLRRNKAKIGARVRQIKFYLHPFAHFFTYISSQS